MPATTALTEETVHRLAPDDAAFQNGRSLVRKGSFKNLGVSSDGTWLLAQCQGSGKNPYEVSVDLAASTPTARCTCPSRKFPCKHGLGLMLAYLQAPDRFAQREPPEDLTAKREKQTSRAQKQASGEAAPRKVNQAVLHKKAAAQRDGLDLLEKLLLDLVAAGQWFEPSRRERLERQAKQMSDAYLPGARVMLQRLCLLGTRAELPEDERNAQAAEVLGRLWATVQKGRNYLDGKIAGDELQAEADAVVEEVLGKAWQLAELREKGYLRQNLSLLELAYERTDDEARQERVETSHLVELRDGTIYQAIAYRPFRGMDKIPGQPSYLEPLALTEAAVYPGFINRRIRWEKGVEQTQPLEARHRAAAYAVAATEFDPVITSFKQQLKHALAPREAVVWLRCKQVGRVTGDVVLEDAKARRLLVATRQPGEAHVANLVRAAGMLQEPAVLAAVPPGPNEHHRRSAPRGPHSRTPFTPGAVGYV